VIVSLRPPLRLLFAICLAHGLGHAAGAAGAQTRPPAAAPPRAPAPDLVVVRPPVPTPGPAPANAARMRSGTLVSTLTFADLGFSNGFRFANLGGRREIFVQLPQVLAINSGELVLTFDDLSAYDARRSLEILVNDRSAAAIALDGKANARTVRIPLESVKTQDGFLKISFQYSGAATHDRCIDVRSVGDSLTIRPESAVEIDVDLAGISDVATTIALIPRDVAIVLPRRSLMPRDLAAALTVARSLAASGRRVTFHYGYDSLPDLAKRSDPRRWSRGLVVIGSLGEASDYLDSPVATLAGPLPPFGTLAAVHIAGLPALMVADITTAQASRLIGSPWLAATRGVAAASIGDNPPSKLPSDRISFTELGLAPVLAEVFGRADLTVAINTRALPAGTRAERLALNIMVAPDGAGERAVVSVFVNERLLGSSVAQIDEPTRFDLALPEGLVGTIANVRAVIQRRSAQGDCRFEPQGYPAQILGTSSVILTIADARARDFSDLVALWANGLEILIPAAATERPEMVLGMLSGVLSALSPEAAHIAIKVVDGGAASAPDAPFIAVGEAPPPGVTPRARFDRGRVVVVDRSDRSVLDLGGFAAGAVAQIVLAGERPGLWIRPLAADGTLPVPAEIHLEHGDVAFVDKTGVALAMSTERPTLVRISYPDQVSWLTVANRYRSWIIGGVWLLATFAFLFALQNFLRRRSKSTNG
jgi:cellulose synthase subunit